MPDVCWGLLISSSAWDLPIFLRLRLFSLRKMHHVLGIIATLCRGALYFLVLGFWPYSVWDMPLCLSFKAATVLVKKSEQCMTYVGDY